MSVLDKLGITKSKGLMRGFSFILLLLSMRYPEVFGNPELIQWLSSLGFVIGQARSMTEKEI